MVDPPAGGLLSSMIQYFTYAIYNKIRHKIYIGHTVDLETRIMRHNKLLPNKKKSFTNKNSGEWQVIYTEIFEKRIDAMRREKELKSFRGREFIKHLIPA